MVFDGLADVALRPLAKSAGSQMVRAGSDDVATNERETGRTGTDSKSGSIALIVGPSGSGKDALLAGARKQLADDPRFYFPKRVVSRTAHASEDFVSMTVDEFNAAKAAGAFSVTWSAHDLSYGITKELDTQAEEGRTCVFNTSRRVVDRVKRRFGSVTTILITAPPEVRADRLAKRGRESTDAIRLRLERAGDDVQGDVAINNVGSVEAGVSQLIAALLAASSR